MDARKPQKHASGFRAMLKVATDLLGETTVNAMVEELGVSHAELDDPNSWFSLEFAESLIERITAEVGDPSWLDRAMRLTISPEYLGILYPLFRSFGTPAFGYRHIGQVGQRLNKITTWTTEEVGDRYVRIAVRPIGEAIERTPYMCRGRRVQLAAGATLFDLPPADVRHPTCLLRGGDACVYEVRWQSHRRPVLSWLGLFAGVACGSLLTHIPSVHLKSVLLPMFLGLGGWALGRVFELRRNLRQRVQDLSEAHDALARSTRAHEERFMELQEAKTAVDEKVDRRTAELRATSQRLEDTLREVEELSRAKNDFFNNVSHELRTPLTLILAPIDDLLSGREPPGGTQAALHVMRRNADRLLTLINQILDLARIDSGRTELRREPTDAARLARATVEAFRSAAARRDVELRLEIDPTLTTCELDRAWIESALTNLLANSLRFVEAGDEIVVALNRTPAELILEVSDTGPGIDPEDQPSIFERFAQASNHDKRTGTGLGLAIVREAARLHGGRAAVRSEPGRGTTFTLTLPTVFGRSGDAASPAPMEPPAQLAHDRFDEAPGRAPLELRGPSADAPLALLIEDNPDVMAYMVSVLESRYRVRTAADGRAGFEAALEHRPDVVVSDVAMPGLDGYALCRALRAEERTRNIPVLLVTARAGVTQVLEGFKAGADDYLLKPFHAQELLARVGVHVRLQRVMREMAQRERLVTLGNLAASVAHQIRNPLTTLISGLPAMQNHLDDKLDPGSREMLGVMVDCAARIERMTVDLLDVSRVDREEQARFAPGRSLLSAVRLLEARLHGTAVRIEHAMVDSDTELMGRPGDVNHVFLNLIDNALKAVHPEGTVRVSAAREEGAFVVRVEDSGSGLSAEARERVFEPFFTTRPAGEGTGLGLSIVLRVVQQHGGTIQVGESDLGGALFMVRFPLHEQRRAAERIEARPAPSTPLAPSA